MLAVNVIAPGGGTFAVAESVLTPGSSDQVTISQLGAGEYRIVGEDGTQVQLNGGALVGGPEGVVVNNIFGDVAVAMGAGTNSLTVEANTQFPANFNILNTGVNDTNNLAGTNPQVVILGNLIVNNAAGTSNVFNNINVLGSVVINNGPGNSNTITDSTINGGLWVSRLPAAGAGQSDLTIGTTTIVGPTSVTNFGPGGSGDSNTTITNSRLLGQLAAAPAAVPGYVPIVFPPGMALRVVNGPGDDKLNIRGETQIGDDLLPLLPLPPTLVMYVVNGSGGSATTVAPVTEGDITRVAINGHAAIRNGFNLPSSVDMATLVNTDIAGGLGIYNDGGPGATNTMIDSSNIGTFLAPAGPGALGGPLVIINETGQDSFTMNSSTAWWGAYVDHDNDPTGVGPETPWPSNTQITNSNVGTRPGGPSSGVGLGAALGFVFPGVTFQLPGALAPGDALLVLGGAGNDVVNVNPTEVGGQISVYLGTGGINSLTMMGNPEDPLEYSSLRVIGLAGNDTVRLENIEIQVNLLILLDAGNDTLELKGNTSLPSLSVGTIVINGGLLGDDRLEIDPTVSLPVDFFTLSGILTGFEP